jgi:hypothetical protein
MKYIICLISIVIFSQIFSIYSYAQQYEDVVYLKNGSIIHGIILEQIPGESIKIKTGDNNLFVFKMDEIEKMTREEVVIKKDDTKKVEKDSIIKKDETKKIDKDSIKSKDIKSGLKSDISQNKIKELLADNSITIQPIGLFTLLTNIEYDRALLRSLSMGLKLNIVTFLSRYALQFEGKKKDVDNAESIKSTFSGWGIGTHIRYYPGNRSVEGFFLGGALDGTFAKYDEVKTVKNYNSVTGITDTSQTTVPHKPTVVRLEFEIGNRSKLSNGKDGFVIQWSLGAGAGFWNDGGSGKGVIPLISFGFGIGYAF